MLFFLTFDDVGNVMIPTDKCSINGALDSKLCLHRFGVTLQVSVWLSSFVDIEFIILMEQIIKARNNNHVVELACACLHVCVFCLCLSP